MFRTASIIVRTLPASTPSGPRTVPSWTCTSRLPRLYEPVRRAGAGDRVRDQCRAAARGAPRGKRGLGREVDAVEDDRDDDVLARERRADDAGVAVQEGTHRVEEVRDAAGAAVERRVCLRGGRVAVAERDGDVTFQQQVDQELGARQLRRERHQPHGAGREQPLEQRRVGIAPCGGLVRAEPVGREERPFEVQAENAWPGSPTGTSAIAASSCCSGVVISVGR